MRRGAWLATLVLACSTPADHRPARAEPTSDEPAGFAILESGECVPIAAADMERQEEALRPQYEREARRYRSGCARRDGFSCSLLAWVTRDGKGTPKDDHTAARFDRRAAELWQSSCDRGDARACSALASAYQNGEGVPVDVVRANRLRVKALRGFTDGCDAHDGQACRQLALAHRLGLGVPKDLARSDELYRMAAVWLDAACARGAVEACNALASMHSGDGLPRNDAASQRYAERTRSLARTRCPAGDAEACDFLERIGERN